MGTINFKYYKTTVGELKIASFNNKLCLCDWRYRKMRKSIDNRIAQGLSANWEEVEKDEVIDFTISELSLYFNQKLQKFSVPLLFVGTKFQKEVWSTLLKIEYGKTQSYAELAKSLGNIKAIRAVATANGANAISILVPCHRIIGSNGELVGYAGGLTAKKRLLQLENAISKNEQLGLF